MDRRLKFSLVFLALLALLAALFFAGREALHWGRFLTKPVVPPGQELIYIIKPGTTMSAFANDLQQRGYLSNSNYLIELADWTGHKTKIKTGEYQFKGGIRPWQLLQQIAEGKVLQRTITFIEGWTFVQLRNRLNAALSLAHTTLDVPNNSILTLVDSKESNPEGLFYPDTYKYTYGITDVDILKKSYHLMEQKLQQAWNNRAADLPYKTPYEALIVASLIEKEAKHPDDRPLVASVINNRLQKQMPLQIDATVIYARGADYHQVIKAKDLKSESAYNTYQHKGLPPTPICMPGLASINAAMHPAKTNYLYYVAKGDGKHAFSETLAEHHAAIQKYLRRAPKIAFDRSVVAAPRQRK